MRKKLPPLKKGVDTYTTLWYVAYAFFLLFLR